MYKYALELTVSLKQKHIFMFTNKSLSMIYGRQTYFFLVNRDSTETLIYERMAFGELNQSKEYKGLWDGSTVAYRKVINCPSLRNKDLTSSTEISIVFQHVTHQPFIIEMEGKYDLSRASMFEDSLHSCIFFFFTLKH